MTYVQHGRPIISLVHTLQRAQAQDRRITFFFFQLSCQFNCPSPRAPLTLRPANAHTNKLLILLLIRPPPHASLSLYWVPPSSRRGRAYAPHADLLWMETAKPNIPEARAFAEGVHAAVPHQKLAYNLSPSFNWDAAGMSKQEMASFNRELGRLGFVWQVG